MLRAVLMFKFLKLQNLREFWHVSWGIDDICGGDTLPRGVLSLYDSIRDNIPEEKFQKHD